VSLSSRPIVSGGGLHFLALGFRYVDRALDARHSLAEMKRMHGQ